MNDEFKPIKIQCLECNSIIYSKKPKQYVECSCGKIAIDQSLEYVRILGDMLIIKELSNEQGTGDKD